MSEKAAGCEIQIAEILLGIERSGDCPYVLWTADFGSKWQKWMFLQLLVISWES